MNKYGALILLIVGVLVNITACKTGKKPTRKKVTVDTTAVAKADTVVVVPPAVPAPPAINEEKKKLMADLLPLWNREINFTTFSAKSKTHYEGMGQKHDFTANIRIQKDKVIWVSVSAFLVSVARVYITPDSFKLINFLQKEATVMPLSEAQKVLPAPVDFSTLQNLIIGNVLNKNGNPTDATDFGGAFVLQMETPDIQQQATYNKADSNMRSLQMRTTQTDGTTGMIQLGNYKEIQGRRFAENRAVNLTNKGEQYYLDMDFNNVEFDQPIETPFSIPKNYTIK